MKMSVNLIKQMGVFSALIGAIVGVITLIPFIGNIVFTVFYLSLSAILIIYLKKINILDDISIKDGGILGAIIGATSTAAFMCVFCPISMLVQFIFGNGWIGQIIVACFSSFLSFVCLIFMALFFIMLASLMNGFAGATTIYIYEILKKLKEE